MLIIYVGQRIWKITTTQLRYIEKDRQPKKGFLSCRYGKIGILNGKSKAVIRFSMNNKLIDEFESINIASNITGINKRGIALAANKKRKTAGGYIWKIK